MTPAVRGERGSAVPFAVTCLGVLLMVGTALAVAAAMVGDHRRAQAAADLAALAGASALADGRDACAAAGRVAIGNGASLARCAAAGRDIRVTVVVTGPRWLAGYRDLVGEARAGPG